MNTKQALLHLFKGIGLFALARTLTGNATRILCYHGGSLGDEYLFNPKLFCRPGLLDQRLGWLQRKGFVPSSFDSLLEQDGMNSSRGIPVIVTLDDGWYSTASELLPKLAEYKHQPVLYLATKVFASGSPVIDVCVRYLLWKSQLGQIKVTGLHADLDGAYDLKQPSEREFFCDATERWLSAFEDDAVAVHDALERLAAALGVPADVLNLHSRRFSYLHGDELHVAAKNGCKVELHGHAHQYLSGQSEQNLADIETCRSHITSMGLPSPRHYCYPSGNYDNAAPALFKQAGVATATTCKPGLINDVKGDTRYFLPRFLDGADVSMIEFEAEMSGVLEFLRRLTGR